MEANYIRCMLLWLFMFCGMLASAAEPDDSAYWKVEDLNPVVVTGTRTPKPLLDSPVLTEVISATQIAKTDATNLHDLLQQIVFRLRGPEHAGACRWRMARRRDDG